MESDFVVETSKKMSSLYFPNVTGLNKKSKLHIKLNAPKGGDFSVELRRNNEFGSLITVKKFKLNKFYSSDFSEITLDLQSISNKENLCFIIKQKSNNQLKIDSFSII